MNIIHWAANESQDFSVFRSTSPDMRACVVTKGTTNMHKRFSAKIFKAARTNSRSFPKPRNAVICLAIALTLAISTVSDSNADDLNRQGTNKIAEMTALVRHSDPCPQVPREWSVAYLMLLIMAPPMEEQVKEMEHKMLALRDKIGLARWCQLYSVEMWQAYLIIKQTWR
jgi:hypothetical protein